MKTVINSQGVINKDYPSYPLQGVQNIAHAGFQNMVLDLSMFQKDNDRYCIERAKAAGLSFPIVRVQDDSGRGEILSDRTRLMYAGEGMQICEKEQSQYLLCRPFSEKASDKSEKTTGNRQSKEIANMNGKEIADMQCKEIVDRNGSIRTNTYTRMNNQIIWEQNQSFFLQLARQHEENATMILLQNCAKNQNGHLVRGVCSDPIEAKEWIERLNEQIGYEKFGFCLDIGIATLCGQNLFEYITTIGEHIKAVIVRDSDGIHDNAMLPFSGIRKHQSMTDWMGMIRGLRKISYDGILVLDVEDTAAAFSIFLQSKLLEFSKSTADYLVWQIQMEQRNNQYPFKVISGAGNMCQNYMKCYGAMGKPLFICDNNEKIWGNRFCDLEIKNPESLKNLPDGCAIFICNVYYQEITEQLKKMEIKNPIEYISDEYMPAYISDSLVPERRGN